MKRILFASTFRGPSGYANAARSYLKALDSYLQKNPGAFELRLFTWLYEESKLSKEELELVERYELKNDEELKEFCKKDYEVAWFFTPNLLINYLKFDSILQNSKKNTNMVVWETDRVPAPWVQNYKKYFNQIIVPCDWNKSVFESQSGLPTYKIPYLLNFENNEHSSVKKQNNVFNIFSMSQWTSRKGFDLLIKAYCSEFYHNEDVLLTIKTYGFGPATGKFEEDRNQIIADIKNTKNSITHYLDPIKSKINVVTGLLTKPELQSIFNNSHIFCLPTRGEGFGLTIAEAISNALPVITPNKGGHIDYIHKDNFFIDSRFMTSIGSFTKDYSSVEMKLVEPDLDDLRIQLRNAYNLWKEKPEQLAQIGLESRKFLQDYCNPEKITNDLVNVLLS